MARVRTVEFLPEIFQTPVNRQFLNATLDQLTQEPAFQKTQGFVGRKVGPGVNPQDKYVIEPTRSRNDYQLEPGVISLQAETKQIVDAITYPGINDALKLQGANVSNADRLYSSEYYSWDPFVDFDKFINYSQYYWLPAGPLAVDVAATGVPLTDTFAVTRANGVYTFSGIQGNNPVLTLVRGGSYDFQVAQTATEDANFRVSNENTTAYVIDYEDNPELTLVRGSTYTFTLVLSGDFPFYIKTQATLGTTNLYTGTLPDGSPAIQNNGAAQGTITFTVPQNAPDVLYYVNPTQFNMRGTIKIVNGQPGTGPGFWIQSDPGVNGRVPATPNISSRDVLGVINNGEDLGTVTFNVPESTAQDFYYTLSKIGNIPGKVAGTVDLVTSLKFNEINNVFLDPFFEANPDGIDGITSLDGKTLVFLNEIVDAEDGGWQKTTQFDPLPGTAPDTGLTGSYDTTTFDQTTDIATQAERYSVWQISYVTSPGGSTYMQLNSVLSVSNLQKFSIQYGNQYSSTQWYKNASGYFEQIPLLTAIQNLLFYQDGTDPEIFGQIRLIDQDKTATIFIEDIVGKKNYTSPNGVIFTNGLKVVFRGDVQPASYQNQEYYVEGVGTAIQLLPVINFITPEPYTNSESVPYDSTPYDVGNYDATLNAPQTPDYLTVNRASTDLNPWTRSNRWFHIDVIYASATYNNTTAVVDNLFRARRPILEFRAGTKLFDFGTQGKQPVNIIDFAATDALSTINGTTGYSIDGYAFTTGTRVIFAADADPQVRSKIYEVEFIVPDTVPPLIAEPIINLVPATDATVLVNQNTVCLSGSTLQGKSFYFDGVDWLPAQSKTSVNQAPLFDIYDSAGVSFSDRVKYPSSTFRGSKLFSYATSNTTADPVLGFPLRYLSLANVGDIVFDNNLYTDTFNYVQGTVGTTLNVSQGFVRQYSDRTNFVRELGWQTAVTRSLVRQQFQFTYDGGPLLLDVKVDTNPTVPAIQLFVNSKFQDPSNYSYITTSNTTTITLKTAFVPGDIIEVAVLSDQISQQGFYQVPINLENNPFNANSATFTLGTVRSHYETIGQNLLDLQGPIIGANNTRDLGNIVPYGLQILQQSSPLTLPGYFMRSEEYDVFAAIDYNSREYIKYKNLLLEAVIRNEYPYDTSVADILDSAIATVTQGRTDINPFYWSDMLPAGSVFTELKYTITPITNPTFNTGQTFDFTSANYLGLLVYLTRDDETVLLVKDVDYTVSIDAPTITVSAPLVSGDVITLREYNNTAGSFCPNTPSKMGLYPKYVPSIFVDVNYVNPVPVIQGHDGSITVAFGDIRDQVLLEFERRIYNNIKTDGNPVPLMPEDVIPGFFRNTGYSQTDINNILGESFLTWVGWNKLDYKAQDYVATDPFTYNYSAAGNKINNQPLLGAWRGIYRYFYDTSSPNYTPWQMLGLSEKPTWWEDRYGPAPYTSDNLILWDDLAAGLVADPIAPYIKPNYARPRLTEVIPNGTENTIVEIPESNLLPPLDSVVGAYDPNAFRKSWVVGDGGPVEASWWSSSSYPFAVMRLLALTKPAEFFALFADRDLYKYDLELGQYLYQGRYRLNASGVQVYGNGVSKASYINWIVDYNRQLGRNSTTALETDLANLDVRLCYRMAAFTDKQYLKIFVERSSPNSTNSSLLLPDDSYNLLLYKNQPFNKITYSALIIERTQDGYAVYGYNNQQPYFSILASASNGLLQTVAGGGAEVRVPAQYTDTVVQIPYGYVFTNTTMVVDFILSYGQLLKTQGLIFDDRENGYTLNWNQMATEFLYFSQQGWAPGTIINLNPAATTLKAFRAGEVVDTIVSTTPENLILDQNRTTLPTRDLIVQREGDSFSVTSASNQAISYLNLKFTNYENMVVFDNVSIFSDLVYDPITAARQNRVRIAGAVTTDWNGVLDAQGFILNRPNVQQWQPNRKYTKGEIVLYKNNYWQAASIVQPRLEFDYNDWYKSNWDRIQQGLLPNLANKADQLANSYNTQTANLERDNDLFSYGLIGFRPRQYMTDLNLDDVSQVNLYQQFLKTKGTTRAAEIFTQADLGKESGEYQIYENWGVLVSTYGANANRSFFELRLNEANLRSDPCTVQVIEPGQSSSANQTILLQDIWRESYKLTSTDILPTTFVSMTDTALPSAGYVKLDEVDITVFSLDDPTSISANLDIIGVGTTIWAAKSNSYDWNVYRCSRVPSQLISVTDNLNSTSVALFDGAHGLSRGDLIVVRYFGDAIDGVYRVLSVPGINTVTIAYSFNSTNQTTVTGQALVFYLQTMRVDQASDVANLPYANSLLPGARAYVDNNGAGHWEVLEKQNPFSDSYTLTADPQIYNSKFGTSIAQTQNLYTALIGAPGQDTDIGRIYSYRQELNSVKYTQDTIIELRATDTRGYGNTVRFGKNVWAIAGASASRNNTGYAASLYRDPVSGGISTTQIFLSPDQNFGTTKFGTAVAISTDERWMYVSAPYTENGGRVYAYGRVDVQKQSVSYRTTNTAVYNWANNLVIDPGQPDQLVVILNNLVMQYGTDYTIDAVNVNLTSIPASDQLLIISRRQSVQLDSANYFGIEQDSVSPPGGQDAMFTVNVTRGVYNVTLSSGGSAYTLGDQLTVLGTQIGGATPANDLVITVTDVDGGGGITSFTYTGSGVGTTTSFSLTPYLYTATDIYSFSVYVDGIIQRPHIDYEFNNDSTVGTQDLDFLTIPPVGASISVISDTYWQYCDTLTVSGLDSDTRFGLSLSTTIDGRQIFVGAPRDSAVDANNTIISNAGSVYVFDRSVIKSQITNTSVKTYSIPGTVTTPIMIMYNNQFLNIRQFTDANGYTSTQFIDGQVDVDLQLGQLTLLNNLTMTVGDTLTIETNQFKQIQKLTANAPIDESEFGYAVDVCSTNCSLYTGAPLDSYVRTGILIPQAGSVERNVNQSRVYGVTTSTIANPALNAGDRLRINDYQVAVPSAPNNNVNGLISAINSANIPNVTASATPDAEFVGDGVTKSFDIGTTYSAAQSYTPVVYVADVLQTLNVDYTYNNSTQTITFFVAPNPGVTILVVSGRIVFSVKNLEVAEIGNKLTVLPGLTGSAFEDLGMETFVFTQKILSPNPTDYAQFGKTVHIDTGAVNLVVGAPNGNVYEPTTFDGGKTYFNDRSTTFFNPVFNSGVVFSYDYLPSANDTVTNPGQFVFGQQIYEITAVTNDEFGLGLDYTNGQLLVGAPGNDAEDSTVNYGLVSVFENLDKTPAWTVIHSQQPVVDVGLLNGVFMYDRLTSNTQTYFDFIDPLQGKILGAASRNLDYIGAVDPASYNVGTIHNQGTSWGAEHVGEMWWDTDTVRFIDPNQDDITYASRRWSQVFPGSRVDVYQWIESSVPPVSYTGTGTPLSTTSYSVRSELSKENIFVTSYYFWVRGIPTIQTGAGKTLSTTGVARYIESPRTSGIPYIAGLNSSTVAIYNGLEYISAADTILHIDYDRQATDANIHTEYQLIADGQADSFLNATLYRKLQDSFCGADTRGAAVPDPLLSPAERYGVQFRPRQSMFANRFLALQNYLTRANTVLKQYPIVESKNLSLLNSSEPIPPSTVDSTVIWNKSLANIEELSYQNIETVPLGYKYLILSDSTHNGFWAIYQVIDSDIPGQRETALNRVQNYDTRQYWYHIDWYQPGYNSTIQPVAEVPVYSALSTLSLAQAPVGSSVKVIANAQGKFEIYLRTPTGWDRVGLQDGTLQFREELWNYSLGNFGFDVEVFDAQNFDQEPVIETRRIIQAINEQLFVDDLAIERNRSLILMFNFIYSEFTAPDWLIKTSLVDVNHNIRALLPFQSYLRDNQTFVLDYIQEVKPYHVQIREFNLAYFGQDDYPGDVTDFDVPAYWNTLLPLPQFTSPVLTPYTASNSLVESTNSDSAPDAEIWTLRPWSYWFENYLLSIQDVVVVNGGAGYTVAPQVTVTGDCIEQAEMSAIINSAGRVVAIQIDNPGRGYSTTAVITFNGGNGTGARAVSVMGNDLIRSLKTVIKYDRCEYTSTVVDWQANVEYDNGTLVRYDNKVWEASNPDSTPVINTRFDPAEWTLVDANTLSGADRTMGYYTPNVNEPGLSLPLLIDGIDYPGVQVTGVGFDQNTGFDVGNYDINPFDNIAYGPEGRPTYDPGILDAIYESYFGLPIPNPVTGPIPPYPPLSTDVNVDGGAYIDTYSSHAPEELIPGSEFDTLDLKVFTRPGSDWAEDGHGFPLDIVNFIFDSANPTVSYKNALPYPITIIVTNLTQGTQLAENIDYTVDWNAQTVTVLNGIANGEILSISVYELGGGNQLFKQIYDGANLGNSVAVPVAYDQIQEFAIFVNGAYLPQQVPNDSTENYEYASSGPSQTTVTFTNTYGASDFISLVAIGPTLIDTIPIDYSWSTPVVQTIIGDGVATQFTLTNSLEYTNPDNLIVTVNGLRARTSAGIEWYGDGSTEYQLPERLGFSQALIPDNAVHVYVDSIPQILGVDFSVEPYTGDVRRVVFAQEPALGSQILIYVVTGSQCYVNGDQLVFVPGGGINPGLGDVIQVTTWNDTRQQNILTKVYVGPVTRGVTVTQNYDETLYDNPPGSASATPGDFDYSAGVTVTVNDLQLTRVVENPDRLWVTLGINGQAGRRLQYGSDFTLSGQEIILASGILGANDVVMITLFTDSVVPEAMGFRIFQDMRGVQAVYRITESSSTTLTQPLSANDDVIHVADASALGQPDLTTNIWGVVMIQGERIMYRERNTVNNTISSLLRGTAGTASGNIMTGGDLEGTPLVYPAGTVLNDLGRGNLLPAQFQNYIVSNSILADGSTTVFVANDINLLLEDSTIRDESVEVYVGGTLVTTGYTITVDNPCTITFTTPPANGVEVTVLVRRGVTWYAPGAGTPSDGKPLQDTNTQAARFLRGL